ncbi:MAG TPA: methyltransferase domain-containing protein [Candidatus Dormibacteraeota bacterium]|nr:methyltransferase domain-containing protein [Candidatus Dormibacteraeota bacterium]
MSDRPDPDQNSLVRERFTRTAEAFAKTTVSMRAGEGEKIVQLAQAQPEDIGLDLACGPGTFAIPLAHRTRQAIGLDLTPAFLSLARKRAGEKGVENLWLLCADATAIPIRDKSIHVAVSGYSFHHMKDPLRALGELARVVVPGGRVALVDLYTPEGFDPGVNDRIERVRDASHCHTFTRAEFCQAVEQAGFRIHSMELHEDPRRFSQWMHIAGWKPDDPVWREVRRLMEKELTEDASGFHPRTVAADGPGEPEIEFTHSCIFLAATRT